MTVAELTYRPKGAAARLFSMRDPEILYESPAGAGKTRAIGEYCNALCEEHPGIRILFCRQTRASLSESVMPIFEQHVLWPGHPALLSGGGSSRSHYQYPNGSRIVLQGLEEPERTYSSQYDIVVVYEAFEITLTAWQMLARACRNGILPWQQMIAETNPAEETHWLNTRAKAGTMRRLRGRHEDNPSLRPEYLARLAGLTGYLRARLYLGEWVGVSGLVWETYDPAIHLLDEAPWDEITWYFGAQDWGFTDPGCFQVYGVVPDAGDKETGRPGTRDNDRIVLLAEWYHTGQSLDWWAEQAVAADRQFGLSVIVADPSRPDCIQKFNDMIGVSRGRGMARVARPADNKRRSVQDLAGLDLVRWAFSAPDEYGPRLYILRDALQHGPDPALIEKGKPTCTREEIPGYAFEVDKGGEALEDTKHGAADHGCFPAGTPVLTETGWRPIETIAPGEFVATPDGFGRVAAAGTLGVKKLYELAHEYGTLVATGDHPVWSDGAFRRLDSLGYGDTVALCPESRLLSGMGVSGDATRTPAQDISRRGRATTLGASLCIASCGSGITAQFPQGATYITSTATLGTMTRRTLSAARRGSILASATSPPASGYGFCANASSGLGRLPQSGTAVRRAARGTSRTASTAQRYGDRPSVCVASVARSTARSARRGDGFAATPANRRGGAPLARMISTSPATHAGSVCAGTDTLRPAIASRVLRVVALGRSERIYNLTVEPQGVYYAAGVLLSNCDTMRYAATFAWKRDMTPPVPPKVYPKWSYGDVLGLNPEEDA